MISLKVFDYNRRLRILMLNKLPEFPVFLVLIKRGEPLSSLSLRGPSPAT